MHSHTNRTCFYALCLIAKTPQGANTLLESNWTSVRHSLEEKWPLVFDPNFELSEDVAFTSSEEFPTKRPFNVLPAPFIQSPFELSSPQRSFSTKSFSGDRSLPGRVAALGREPVEQAQEEAKSQTTTPPSVLQLKKISMQHRALHKTDSTMSEIVQPSDWARRGAFGNSRKRRFAASKDRSASFVKSEKGIISRRSQRSPMRETKSPLRPKSLSSADVLDSPADDRGRIQNVS